MYEYRFDKNAIQHGVWKNLIAFVHGYNNKDTPDMMAFQQKEFLSPSSKYEALIQLYPFQAPIIMGGIILAGDAEPPYLKSRAQYQEHVYRHRIHTILSNISAHKPEVVLMYGMDNINSLKSSITNFSVVRNSK